MARQHTPSNEDYRIVLQTRLESLLRGEEESMAFSKDLSNEERAYVHSLAPKLGLTTKSSGKGDDR